MAGIDNNFKQQIASICTNLFKLNGDKKVTESDVKTALSKLKLPVDINSLNISSLTKAVTGALKDYKNTDLFSTFSSNDKDISRLEQLLTATLMDESVFKQVDGNLTRDGKTIGKADGTISEEEMEAYIDSLSQAYKESEDGEYLSLDDFDSFFKDKNNEIENKKDKINLQDTVDKTASEVKKSNSSASTASASGGGGGGGLGDSYDTGNNPTGSQQNNDYGPSQTEPYPDKIDTSLLATAQDKELYVQGSIDNLNTLADLGSSGLTGKLESGENIMSDMINLSKTDRENLQKAACEKENAKSEVDKAKEAVKDQNSEYFQLIEAYEQALEVKSEAEENVNDLTTQVETFQAQVEALTSSITSIEGSISSVQSELDSLKEPQEDATESEKASYRSKKQALQGKLAELKNQKQALEEQKNSIENQLSQTQSQLEAAVQYLNEATSAIEEKKAEVDNYEGQKTEEETAYLKSVSDYQEKCTNYINVKNEVMKHIQEETKEQSKQALELRNKNDAKVDIPSSDTKEAQDALKIFEEISSGNLSEDTKKLLEKYNSLTEKEKAFLKEAFGGEGQVCAMLATIGKTNTGIKEGEEYSYTDWIINNVKSLMTELGDVPEGGYSPEKLYGAYEKIDSTKDKDGNLSIDNYCKSLIISGLMGNSITESLLDTDDIFKNQSGNMSSIINNFASLYDGKSEKSDSSEENSKTEVSESESQNKTDKDKKLDGYLADIPYCSSAQLDYLSANIDSINSIHQDGTKIIIEASDGTTKTISMYGKEIENE